MHKLLFILFLFTITTVNAQKDLLAKNYFEQGKYEKALTLYNTLYKESLRLDYFKAIIATQQQLENYSEAELLLKSKLNSQRINPQLFVELGFNYSLQEND